MKKIKLTNGKFAIVDNEDFVYLNRFRWAYCKPTKSHKPHAHTSLARMNNQAVPVEMEKFLIRQKTGYLIWHKNGDSLDNRKKNLTLVKISIVKHKNIKNRFGRKTSSQYKGVSFHKKHKYWRASIMCDGKRQQVTCDSEIEAAEWYNKKARELFGEFAYQNKI